MDSTLALAEMLIPEHPDFKLMSRVGKLLWCFQIPHILKSRSPSVAASEKNVKTKNIYDKLS